MKRPSRYRRPLLGALGAAALFGPAVFSGCAVNFTPPGKVDSLRVLAVTVDKPYVAPIDADACAADATKCTVPVTFEMDVVDGLGISTEGAPRPINILWLGGCFNPEGDQYSLCVIPLLELFGQAQAKLTEAAETGTIPDFGDLPIGYDIYAGGPTKPSFTVQVPDIVSSRPEPEYGPHYGIGYVFFLACAGKFGLIDADPSAAGNFPIGCFDVDTNEQLGAESFVPGYTQIYSFADGRENGVPEITGVTLFRPSEGEDDENAAEDKGEPLPEGEENVLVLPPCDVPPQDRNQPASCTREDAFIACDAYEIQVEVPKDVGEEDPGAEGEDGETLRETVWVNYYTDTGDFENDIKLINDPQTGYIEEHRVRWIPPATPGRATIWIVVRDSRGGSSSTVRYIDVE